MERQRLTNPKYRLKAQDLKPLRLGLGACLATNRITVEGFPVHFMYRQKPDHAEDSGWRFFSGTEDDDYMNDPDNSGAFDVNTIANYDPSILPFLDASIGSVFEREGDRWGSVTDFEIPE